MKFFVCFALIIAVAVASPTGIATNQEVDGQEVQSAQAGAANAAADLTRLRKSAYGGASASAGGYGQAAFPAPPCPKNYLFSCQPNLAPVPCSAPSNNYGSVGAYSAPVPAYYEVPQAYVPRGVAYANPQYY